MRFLVPVFIFLTVLSVSAQDKVVLSTNPPPVAPKEVVVTTLGSAGLYYQEFKDRSVARNQRISLFKNEIGWGNISASFISNGKTLITPSKITINLFIAAKDRTYVDDTRLAINIDGKKLFNGDSELTDGRTNGRDVYSSLKVEVSLEEFKKLAKAKRIELKVGPTQFELTNETIGGFRDLVSLIEAS